MKTNTQILITIKKILMATLCCCLSIAPLCATTYSSQRKIRARITYYCPGEDRFGSRVASKDVKRATPGITVSAHPNFKFGTRIYIPALKNKIDDGKFTVQDRGSAVTNKAAAGGKAYVFDIFVASHQDVKKMTQTAPAWCDVYILD